jgi:hypothetical protein
MRSNRELSPAGAAMELVLPKGNAFDAQVVFGRLAPLEIDLGCGDGTFLSTMAQAFPERDFVGVEKLLGRVRSACRKIAARGLPNARIWRTDIDAVVTELLPPGSVAVCHLLFPDPWPKRRHHVRRTVTAAGCGAWRRRSHPAGSSASSLTMRITLRTWNARSRGRLSYGATTNMTRGCIRSRRSKNGSANAGCRFIFWSL